MCMCYKTKNGGEFSNLKVGKDRSDFEHMVGKVYGMLSVPSEVARVTSDWPQRHVRKPPLAKTGIIVIGGGYKEPDVLMKRTQRAMQTKGGRTDGSR